jgi:hypothetical protein
LVLILSTVSVNAADIYPITIHSNLGVSVDAESVPQAKADMVVWMFCVNHGFTYDNGTYLDPSIAVIVDGEITASSVAEAFWPAGQAAAMRQFYADKMEEILRRNYGIAVLKILSTQSDLDNKRPDDYAGNM